MPPFPAELTLGSSSHWRREIGTNNSINFHINQNIFFQLHFHLLRFGSNLDDKEEIAKFPVDYLSLIHMISNSKNYAVVIWYPVTMNMMDMPGQFPQQFFGTKINLNTSSCWWPSPGHTGGFRHPHQDLSD